MPGNVRAVTRPNEPIDQTEAKIQSLSLLAVPILLAGLCAAHDCRFVFYDHAKPGNGRWCSTEGCGNRNKTRTYRRRHTAAQH